VHDVLELRMACHGILYRRLLDAAVLISELICRPYKSAVA